MPLDAVAPVLRASSFPAMGTSNTVVVDDPDALGAALDAAREVITAVDETCSRFKPDSELCRLNRGAGGPAQEVSALLADAVATALAAAASTDGLVDPTIGRLIEQLGYTVTFKELPEDGPPINVRVRSAPGWYTVVAEPGSRFITLPAAVSLDLGAVGKAWAADRAAAAASARTGIGVMVGCGGDVAVVGSPPEGGWPIRVAERVGAQNWQDITVFDGGVATSGTSARSWRRGGRVYHHILNPATGLPADTPWRLVTVAAASCAQANAAATAAVIRGADGPDWLDGLGLPARLVGFDGRTVTVGSWPGAS